MMRPIQTSLKKWIKENEGFQQRYAELKQSLLTDPHIAAFIKKHPELTDEHIEKHLNKLYEYKSQSKQCHKCRSYDNCQNMLKGYSPILSVENNDIHISYEKCKNRIKAEQRKHERRLIQSIYMPKEILEARIEQIEYDPHRTKVIKEVSQFLDEAKNTLPGQGLYLTGPFGVGKTYFIGAIANKLQEYNISSTLIYMPELVREMNEAIKNDNVQEKIELFKQTDVLMLDDIGAETFSAWFRDEVLGSILQYRMMENLPVFFTSNYTMKQLEEVLSTSRRGGVERVKAGRIMERIRQVSKEVVFDGVNRRHE